MSAAGEASATVLRFFSFIGAGVICTKAINMYLDHERKQEEASAAAEAAAAAATSESAVLVASDGSPASAVAAAKP